MHRDRLQYREVHSFANHPRAVTDADGTRWCWDTDALWQETLAGLGVAVRDATSLGDRMTGIGVDTWGVDYGLVSARGDLIGPAVHHRSASEELVTQAGAFVPEAEAWTRTGIEKAPMNTSGVLLPMPGRGFWALG